MTDAIKHPAHYGGGDNPYEAIKVIDAWVCNFNTGNTYKYMARAGIKTDPDLPVEVKLLQDLGKGKWYLEHQLRGIQRRCIAAMQRQPLIMPEQYHFLTTVIAIRAPSELFPAYAACYDQTSEATVERGVEALDKYIRMKL